MYVTSGHQAALKLAKWIYEQKWSADRFARFFERYYTECQGNDWDAVSSDGDHTTDFLHRLRMYSASRHRALLELEIAKTAKAASVPLWIPTLSFEEECVLDELADGQRTWRELLTAKPDDMSESKFRALLSRMKDRGLLVNQRPRGHSWGPLAEVAMRKARED